MAIKAIKPTCNPLMAKIWEIPELANCWRVYGVIYSGSPAMVATKISLESGDSEELFMATVTLCLILCEERSHLFVALLLRAFDNSIEPAGTKA